MATNTYGGVKRTSVILPEHAWMRLYSHLFPGDEDEHAAVALAGIHVEGGAARLLVRDVILAKDGIDYIPGERGYRHLKAEFIHDQIRYCRENGLAYIAIHNHGGRREVGFSDVDLASHERGYPTLLDLNRGVPVGALVFAHEAAAGDIWWSQNHRTPTYEVTVVGKCVTRLFAAPRRAAVRHMTDSWHDRQIRMFGPEGQASLRTACVGVIGAGGVGSLLIEYLSRLGVGKVIAVDPDKVETSNLSRIVGSSRWDAGWPFASESAPVVIRRLGQWLARRKTDVVRRIAKQACPQIEFAAISKNVATADAARQLAQCDFLFLAADTAQARLIVNAIVHQYLIPGIQIGSKVRSGAGGALLDAFSVVRWMLPGQTCLWCSGLISPDRLAWEAKTPIERKQQAYGTEVVNPSVITLNAIGASHAANAFLFGWLGLGNPLDTGWSAFFHHIDGRITKETMKPDVSCSECGLNSNSRYAKGDTVALPESL